MNDQLAKINGSKKARRKGTELCSSTFLPVHCCKTLRDSWSMNGENRLLVPDELVKFQEKPVEVEGFRKTTDRFRGI